MRKYGGSRSIAHFIEAIELENTAEREERMAETQKGSQEDLDATWVGFQWLRHARGLEG